VNIRSEQRALTPGHRTASRRRGNSGNRPPWGALRIAPRVRPSIACDHVPHPDPVVDGAVPEVERICDSLVAIDAGRLLRADLISATTTETGVRVRRLLPADESLENVFSYLVAAS
jgi:hypothetical protein